MLKQLIRVNNVGLLQDGVPKPLEFGSVALFYAENGCGKTTFAKILRAVTDRDVQAIQGARTLDSEGSPHIQLQWSGGIVKLDNGVWTGPSPDIFVFGATFVEDNVYSGRVFTSWYRVLHRLRSGGAQ